MRKITGLLLAVFSLALTARPAFADTISICPGDTAGNRFSKLCELDFANFGGLISKVIILLLIVAVIIAVFFLIWGGIKWIISGGDKAGVESARNHIIAAVVGLIIALLAFFIVSFIGGFFGLDFKNITPPSLLGPS